MLDFGLPLGIKDVLFQRNHEILTCRFNLRYILKPMLLSQQKQGFVSQQIRDSV